MQMLQYDNQQVGLSSILAVHHQPAADMVEKERDRIQITVQFGVVIEAAVPLQLHCLP